MHIVTILCNVLLLGLPLLTLLFVYQTKASLSFLYKIENVPATSQILEDSKKRFRAIFSFFSVAFGASLALAYFFLGFHTEVLVAYDKTYSDKNDYDWFLPSDIMRFPIDQRRNLDPSIAPKLEEREIDTSKYNPVQYHLIVVDITASTYNQSPFSKDLSTEIKTYFNSKTCNPAIRKVN